MLTTMTLFLCVLCIIQINKFLTLSHCQGLRSLLINFLLKIVVCIQLHSKVSCAVEPPLSMTLKTAA